MNALTRFEKDLFPFTTLSNIKEEMEHLLDSFLEPTTSQRKELCCPAVDIVEEKDKYLLRVELPGIKQEDISVTLDKDVLTLKGVKKSKEITEESEWRRMECSYGSFTRSFHIPGGVKTEDIEAAYKDGILEISLKKIEESKSKQIEVKIQ